MKEKDEDSNRVCRENKKGIKESRNSIKESLERYEAVNK